MLSSGMNQHRTTQQHRRSQEVGALGARAVHPHGGEKIVRPNLQGKVVSAPPCRECTPEAEQESNFLGNWGDSGGVRGYLGSFSMF